MIKSQRKNNKRSGVKRADVTILTADQQFKAPWSLTFPPGMIGFPDRLGVTLKYSETFSYSGSATPAAQVYMINSCFDPNVSGVGHQPSYYDTLQAIYARYCVTSFSAIIEFSNHAALGVYAVANYSDQNISGNSVEQLTEAKLAKTVNLGNVNQGTAQRRLVMPRTTLSRVMGQKFLESDPNMYAAVGSNPSDQAFLIIKVAADDGVTAITVQCKVTLLFEVDFKDLLPQVSS